MGGNQTETGDGHASGPGVEQQRFLDLVFRQVPGAAWATDRELRLLWVMGRVRNERHDSESFTGLTVFEYIGSDDEDHPAVAGHRAALEGRRAQIRYERQGHCYEVLIEPLRSDEGDVIGTVGAAVDVSPRQKAETKLAESEARLSAAQRLAHVGSWQWSLGDDQLWWSDEMHRIHGIEPGTFPGDLRSFLARVHEEDRTLTEQLLQQALQRRSAFEYTHRIVRPEGEVRTMRARGAVEVDDHGNPTRLVGACWDVTEQVQVQAALEASVSLLRGTLNSTADGILVVDRHGRVSAVNDRFAELWRVPRPLIEGGDDETLLSGVLDQLEEPQAFCEQVRALYADPERESFDVVRFRDGRVLERYSGPQRVGDDIVGRVWSFRDVTERMRLLSRTTFLADASRLLATLDAERALKSIASLTLGTMAEACAIDLITEEGACRLVTACRDEAPPELAIASAATSSRPQLYRGVGRTWMSVPVTARRTLLAAIHLVAPEGRAYVNADLETAVELGARVALTLQNARAHEAAVAALQARDEVLAVAAHEIRGPLTSMRLAIQTLKNRAVERYDAAAFELLDRENRRLSRFVDELLDAVRMRGGLLNLHLEQVDLAAVVHEVKERMAEEIGRSGSELTLTVDGPVVGVWDRDRLHQIVANLLSNAVKYGLGNPITLALTSDDEQATITVADRGIGIAPNKIAGLFQPFERAVSTRHYGGLGLGLYIVRTIAESLGGSVEVTSEEGQGSVFTLHLPRQAMGTGKS